MNIENFLSFKYPPEKSRLVLLVMKQSYKQVKFLQYRLINAGGNVFKKVLLSFIAISLALLNPAVSSFARNNTNTKKSAAYIPPNVGLLAVSETNLDSRSTKPGDIFQAKLAEGLMIGENVAVQSGSTVYGVVTRVSQPKRIPVRNASIILLINEIQTPDGQRIALGTKDTKGVVISPYSRTVKTQAIKGGTIRAASYGTTIPLSNASTLNGGVVYAIGIGASAVTGGIVGFLIPDVGTTRLNSSANGFINGTPIGPIRWMGSKGKIASINKGEGIILTLKRAAIEKIQAQSVALQSKPVEALAK